jgi:hypothetical protein
MNMATLAARAVRPPRSPLSVQLHRRATAVMARERLRRDLRGLVFDILGLRDSSELPAETAAWVDSVAESAVARVCDTSVSALLESIEPMFAEAPPSVVARLRQAAMRQDAGIE